MHYLSSLNLFKIRSKESPLLMLRAF